MSMTFIPLIGGRQARTIDGMEHRTSAPASSQPSHCFFSRVIGAASNPSKSRCERATQAKPPSGALQALNEPTGGLGDLFHDFPQLYLLPTSSASTTRLPFLKMKSCRA